jgi:hypothetical protein
MSSSLPPDELVNMTLSVDEWVKVAAGLVSVYGLEDETFLKVRLNVVMGN